MTRHRAPRPPELPSGEQLEIRLECVPCPDCDARPGEHCTSAGPDGAAVRIPGVHAGRQRAWRGTDGDGW